MNRPPGQGFPYDQEHPLPAEYGVPEPFGRILCGYPIVPAEQPNGPILCANTAPCPIHRDKRVDHERDAVEAALNNGTPEGDGSFDDITATGTDEAYAAAISPALRGFDPDEAVSSEIDQRREHLPHDPIPKYDPDSPLDLHDQLHADDDHAWHPKARLAAVLGRRALATRLVDALHRGTGSNLLAAELADRLDTLVTQALTEQQAAITQQLSDEYHQARERLADDAARKLKELHDERYRRPSRLD